MPPIFFCSSFHLIFDCVIALTSIIDLCIVANKQQKREKINIKSTFVMCFFLRFLLNCCFDNKFLWCFQVISRNWLSSLWIFCCAFTYNFHLNFFYLFYSFKLLRNWNGEKQCERRNFVIFNNLANRYVTITFFHQRQYKIYWTLKPFHVSCF